MIGRTGVVARRLGLAPPVVVLFIFIHVSNCFGYMMVIVTYGELRNMRSPCSEARSRFSGSSGRLPSKEVLAYEAREEGQYSTVEACR